MSTSKIKESEYFVDPCDSKSADGLAQIAAATITAMARIYESRGTQSDVLPEIGGLTPADQEVYDVVRKLLERESKTRLFNERFMGQIHPQGNKVAIIANMVAAFMNTNTIVEEVSPQENIMEREVTERLATWFGYQPDRFSGNIVTGGTTANIAALWVAREKTLAKHGEQPKLYVLASKMKHYSIAKTCDLLGKNIEVVSLPVDNFKTDVEATRKVVEEIQARSDGKIMLILGIAGETETGLVDDLSGLAAIASDCGAHFHVDAAYGGPFVHSKVSELFSGIDHADSITVDPHKLMYVPYAAGAILFKNKHDQQLIEAGMKEHARYLLKIGEMIDTIENERLNYGMARIEGSMGSAGVLATWATLELFGETGLTEILNKVMSLTTEAHATVLKSKNLRPLFVPETNTLLIGLQKEKFQKASRHDVITHMQKVSDKSGFYISVNEGVDDTDPALRLVVMHPHTTGDDVTQLITILDNAAKTYLDSR